MGMINGNSAVKNVTAVRVSMYPITAAVGVTSLGIVLVSDILIASGRVRVLGKITGTITRAVHVCSIAAGRIYYVTGRNVLSVVFIPFSADIYI